MAGWMNDVGARLELGDARLKERFARLVEAFVERPTASIPEACGRWAATQAAYRFFDNDAVVPDTLREVMAQATAARAQGRAVVLAVQDTTSFDYTSHTDTSGLGPLENPQHRGLFAHSTLAVDPDDGVPLGIVGQQVWARDSQVVGKRQARKAVPIEAKESKRWLVGLQETEARLSTVARVVTVADREADIYELFALASHLKGEWLIRARHDRRVQAEFGHLLATVEQAPVCARTQVELVRTNKREARRATLEVRRAQVTLLPPQRAVKVIRQWWAEHPQTAHLAPAPLEPLTVGVVLAREVDAPADAEPVEWLLLTSLPNATVDDALLCIAYYRLRWLVERYHFVLKSGCLIERLQLESAERLQRALVVYSEVAWRLLWLTYEARVCPEAPCSVVFDEPAWQLIVLADCPTATVPLTPPDLRTAVRKVAMLGGFLGRKGDGEPGVKTLWRGLRRLNDMVAAVRLLQEHPNLLPDDVLHPVTYV